MTKQAEHGGQINLLNKFKIDITSKLKATIGRMEDI